MNTLNLVRGDAHLSTKYKCVVMMLLLCFSFFSFSAYAQTDGNAFVVPNTKVHKIQSNIVSNQIYEVRIALPGSYASSPNQKYPIVVVLDGQWNFTNVADIIGKLAYDGRMPEAITVAITWGGEGDNPDLLRWRDFLRPTMPEFPMSGGASLFLDALTQELIPFVENHYRVADKKVLVGASLGGLFTSYAMVEKPGYFDGHIAVAGAYWVDGEYLDGKLAAMKRTKALSGVRSFLATGTYDGNQAHVSTFNERVKDAHLKEFKNKFKSFSDLGHAGVEPSAYTYGLQYIFERPFLKLSEEFLAGYAGNYEGGFPGGPIFPLSVAVAGKGLLAVTDAAGTYEFQAESEISFYMKGANIVATFQPNGDFILNNQGNILTFSPVSTQP